MRIETQRTNDRAGIALVPAILVVSGLAIFSVALLTAALSGSRTVVHQGEDYQVSSAVESVAASNVAGLLTGPSRRHRASCFAHRRLGMAATLDFRQAAGPGKQLMRYGESVSGRAGAV